MKDCRSCSSHPDCSWCLRGSSSAGGVCSGDISTDLACDRTCSSSDANEQSGFLTAVVHHNPYNATHPDLVLRLNRSRLVLASVRDALEEALALATDSGTTGSPRPGITVKILGSLRDQSWKKDRKHLPSRGRRVLQVCQVENL